MAAKETKSSVVLSWLIKQLDGDNRHIVAKFVMDTWMLLRAHDCKYRESLARLKKSKILIICLENPSREMYSKKLF